MSNAELSWRRAGEQATGAVRCAVSPVAVGEARLAHCGTLDPPLLADRHGAAEHASAVIVRSVREMAALPGLTCVTAAEAGPHASAPNADLAAAHQWLDAGTQPSTCPTPWR